MTLFWLSFADTDLPKGQQFLGVAIVEGICMVDAVATAWALNINPGGEVLSSEVEPASVPEMYRNRLLNREEATFLAGVAC